MRRTIPLILFVTIAAVILSATSAPYLKKEIRVFVDGEELEGHSLRVEVTHALRADKAGGYAKLYEKLLERYDAKQALNYLAIGLGDYLSAECERRSVKPLDATLEWTKGLSKPFIYYDETPGREASLTDVGRAVARAMDRDTGAHAYTYTHESAAAVTRADLVNRTREIARFSTDFRTSGENRRHNIALAAQAINGTVLAPNETFSFNASVGERLEERGYREANIVVSGEFVKGVGGGVCQVSTTLYNAVLLAGLPVEYAAAHSRPVSYVSYSRDCTVSSAIDFRFRNDTDYPIYVAAEIRDCTLTFCLFGEAHAGTRQLESELVEILPYRSLYEDGSTYSGAEEDLLLSPGREGIRSRLYRIEGETRTLIRENRYPPKDAIYRKRPHSQARTEQWRESA